MLGDRPISTELRSVPVRVTGALIVCLLAAPAHGAAKDTAGVPVKADFNRDIRPILSENCYQCHGPDEKERKAKLRLDLKSQAFKPAKSGDYAIVPGDLAKSKLIERIQSKDPDEVMPPPKTGKKLTAQQVELLVGDGLHQGLERRLGPVRTPATRTDLADDLGQQRVGLDEMSDGFFVHETDEKLA